jgi:hypothetical protein
MRRSNGFWNPSPRHAWRWRPLFDWPRAHSAGLRLAKREFRVRTSQTGENFEIFVLFHCHFTRPSIEGQKGVNECSEYVFGVDTSQTVHKVSSSIGQNRGESWGVRKTEFKGLGFVSRIYGFWVEMLWVRGFGSMGFGFKVLDLRFWI